MRYPLIILLFQSFWIQLVSATDLPRPYTELKDLTYLDPGRSEKADLYLPNGDFTEARPAVLLIHGGGWHGGDKADKRALNIASTIAQAGYVVLAINYKLDFDSADPKKWIVPWPQNFYDCKTGLRFLRLHATEYHIDPSRIGVMGESAGGHLALLVGTTSNVDELNRGGLYTEQSNTVSCIIDFYGIPDLFDPSMNWLERPFRGASPAETDLNRKLASPVTHLGKKTPPILIVHGTKDVTVPFGASERFVEKLKEAGTEYQFVPVPGGIHSFDLQPPQMDLRPTVLEFLNKYLGKPASAH